MLLRSAQFTAQFSLSIALVRSLLFALVLDINQFSWLPLSDTDNTHTPNNIITRDARKTFWLSAVEKWLNDSYAAATAPVVNSSPEIRRFPSKKKTICYHRNGMERKQQHKRWKHTRANTVYLVRREKFAFRVARAVDVMQIVSSVRILNSALIQLIRDWRKIR